MGAIKNINKSVQKVKNFRGLLKGIFILIASIVFGVGGLIQGNGNLIFLAVVLFIVGLLLVILNLIGFRITQRF